MLRLAVGAVILFGSAAGVRAAERVTFFPDWFPGAQFAGLYVAIDHGAFRDEDIEIEVVPFTFGQNTPALLDADPVVPALASAEAYILLQRRARGADLCVFTAVLAQTPAGFISLDTAGIQRAGDFAGRRLGVHKFADPFARWFIRQAGLTPDAATLVFVDDDLDLLAQGTVDAMQGYATEEFVHAQRRFGRHARFLSFRELGFVAPAQVLHSTRTQAARHAAVFARFVRALRRGWETALAQPESAVTATLSRLDANADPDTQGAMLEALRPYVSPAGAAPLAAPDVARWSAVSELCAEIGFVENAENANDFCVAPELADHERELRR